MSLREHYNAGAKQKDMAAKLGVCQQTVSAYLRGWARPDSLVRRRMLKHFGIAEAAWDTAEERRFAEAG